MRILQICSSALLRNNGIYKFMNEIAIFARSKGHEVDLLTDSTPIVNTENFNRAVFSYKDSSYTPNIKGDHPWLQYDARLADDIYTLLKNVHVDYDMFLVHDLHGAIAADFIDNKIFLLHESDIMNSGLRYSYLDDDYLARQKELMSVVPVGQVFEVTNDKDFYTPPLLTSTSPHLVYPGKNVLYIGDYSYRKGLDTFISTMNKLKYPTCTLSPEYNKIFDTLNDNMFVSIPGHRNDDKIKVFQNSRLCLFTSRSETFSYAVLEALLYMPVILDGQNDWTANLKEYGAIISNDLEKDVKFWYTHSGKYRNTTVRNKLKENQQAWEKLLDSV